MNPEISIVIRVLNEAVAMRKVLTLIKGQQGIRHDRLEIVVVGKGLYFKLDQISNLNLCIC